MAQAQTQVACEESWVEFMEQDWGEGNNGGCEADGGRRVDEGDKRKYSVNTHT